MLNHALQIGRNPLQYQQTPVTKHANHKTVPLLETGNILLNIRAVNEFNFSIYNLQFTAIFKDTAITVKDLINANLLPKMFNSTITLVKNDKNQIVNELEAISLHTDVHALTVKLTFNDASFTTYVLTNLDRICSGKKDNKNLLNLRVQSVSYHLLQILLKKPN